MHTYSVTTERREERVRPGYQIHAQLELLFTQKLIVWPCSDVIQSCFLRRDSTMFTLPGSHYSRATMPANPPMLSPYSYVQAQFAKAWSLGMRLALTCSPSSPLLWHTVSPCPPSSPLSHTIVLQQLSHCMCACV